MPHPNPCIGGNTCLSPDCLSPELVRGRLERGGLPHPALSTFEIAGRISPRPAMSSSRQPLDWKLRNLRRLIRDEVPESAHLEYKSGEAIARSEKAKKEIGKDISSFANAGVFTVSCLLMESDNRYRLPTL